MTLLQRGHVAEMLFCDDENLQIFSATLLFGAFRAGFKAISVAEFHAGLVAGPQT